MMWARVKGRTENALLQMPFKAVYMFRPGYIQPLHGIRTKTKWYGALYAIMAPLYPVWKLLFPKYVTTTECVGRAMLKSPRGCLSLCLNHDINIICRGGRNSRPWRDLIRPLLILGLQKLDLMLTNSAEANTAVGRLRGLKLRAGSFIQTKVI